MLCDTEIQLGTLKLKNRLAMAPMAVYKYVDNGFVTPALCAHYLERAQKSGVGLIITEHCFVSPEGQAKAEQLSIAEDTKTIGLSALADACHNNGIAAICQLAHAGGAARQHTTGCQPIAPSPIVSPSAQPAQAPDGDEDALLPREMTAEDIKQVAQAFAVAAQRAKDAGFDGVEVHSAHAYLLAQFYSPLLNKRTDAYGGSVKNRVRIHCEVIAAIRDAVGPDFPVGLRLGGCDYVEGGATIEDAVEAARYLQEAGIDYLGISGGWYRFERPGHKEPGWFSDQSIPIKKAVDIPILLAGGIRTLEDAEQLLEQGACDIAGVARALLKNPSWPATQA